MEQGPEVQEELGTGGKFKDWLQDNIRIILSMLIVVAIAGGIYSYSKRGEVPADEMNTVVAEDQKQLAQGEESNDAVTIIGEEEKAKEEPKEEPREEAKEEVKQPEEQKPQEQPQTEQPKEQPVAEQPKQDVQVSENAQSTTSESQETGEAFIEKAVKGDSTTTLARKALKDYLEKNNDSSLSAEHKIYIEDYLRRHAGHQGKVVVGAEVSFSKTLIKDAIEKSKTLNEKQLNHLQKYSVRVAGL